MEMKVGETKRVNGKVRMVAVETKDNICDGCYYEYSNRKKECVRAKSLGECNGFLRTDKKNVIFKQVRND